MNRWHGMALMAVMVGMSEPGLAASPSPHEWTIEGTGEQLRQSAKNEGAMAPPDKVRGFAGVRLGYRYRSAVGGRPQGGFFALALEGLTEGSDTGQAWRGSMRLGTSWADSVGTWAAHLVGEYSEVDRNQYWYTTETFLGLGIERTRWVGEWVRFRAQGDVMGRLQGAFEGTRATLDPGQALAAEIAAGFDFYHALDRAVTLRLHYRRTLDENGERTTIPDGSGGTVTLRDPALRTQTIGVSIGYLF